MAEESVARFVEHFEAVSGAAKTSKFMVASQKTVAEKSVSKVAGILKQCLLLERPARSSLSFLFVILIVPQIQFIDRLFTILAMPQRSLPTVHLCLFSSSFHRCRFWTRY